LIIGIWAEVPVRTYGAVESVVESVVADICASEKIRNGWTMVGDEQAEGKVG
jgi:hypothetical protein